MSEENWDIPKIIKALEDFEARHISLKSKAFHLRDEGRPMSADLFQALHEAKIVPIRVGDTVCIDVPSSSRQYRVLALEDDWAWIRHKNYGPIQAILDRLKKVDSP